MFKTRLLSFLALSLVVAAAPPPNATAPASNATGPSLNVTDAHQNPHKPPSHKPPTHVPNWKKGIQHVVWLLMENRSPHNLFADMKNREFHNPPLCYPINASDPHDHRCLYPQPHDHNSVLQDPGHGASAAHYEAYTSYRNDFGGKATNLGFLTNQIRTYGNESAANASDAINYYKREHVPVFMELAQEYTFFDTWFSAVAGPTNPNRAAAVSGTSGGHGTNDASLSNFALNVKSIFQVLTENNVEWRNYVDRSGTGPDVRYFKWTNDTGHDKAPFVVPHAQFFEDVKNKNLPPVIYLNPSCCGNGTTSMHPSGLVSDGEKYVKDIYEALRQSDYWEKTLFVLSFDENGGFADPVPPVPAPRPDNLTYSERAPDGSNFTLYFNTTGFRVPTMALSPWVPKGHIEHKGKNNGGQYTAASMIGMLYKLFDLKGPPLTPRVEWSSTFEGIFLDAPRKDTPKRLPEPVIFNIG